MRIVAEQMDHLHVVIITRDEVHAYCRMMADSISEVEIQKISNYTDGWISLIYMILLAFENGVPVGMNDSIDELVEKVLFNTYEESIRNFLLKLSLLDIFTARQAFL